MTLPLMGLTAQTFACNASAPNLSFFLNQPLPTTALPVGSPGFYSFMDVLGQLAGATAVRPLTPTPLPSNKMHYNGKALSVTIDNNNKITTFSCTN